MNSAVRKSTAMALAALLGVTSLTGCGSKKEDVIDGTKTVLTVNGEEIPLGVASFYTRYDQTIEYQYIQMYALYGLNYSFDTVTDEESGQTMGQDLKYSLMEDLQKKVFISQHAADYGVELSEEEKSAIADVVKAYVDNNSEEVRAKIGASEADLTKLLEIQTLVSDMRDPMVADVDTNVSDEEAQQTTLTYVEVAVPSELPVESEAESVAESFVTAAESVLEAAVSGAETPETDSAAATVVNAASDESTGSAVVTESGVESVAEEVYDEPAPELQAIAEAKAEALLDRLKAEQDIAALDANELSIIAAEVDEELSAEEGQFTTNDPEDTTLDSKVVEAALALTDGELCDTVIKSEDGTAYYVVRLNKVFDEEATADKKAEIVENRKTEAYDELVDTWWGESKIVVDEKVWAAVKITDQDLYIQTMNYTDTESEAESAAESAAEANTNAAEPVLSEAESAFSMAESLLSLAESLAG